MRPRCIPLCLAVLAGTAALAPAQEPTRAGELRQAREARTETAAPAKPGRVERFLNMIERRKLFSNLFAPADGFGVRIGGIDDGGGLALGPAWRTSKIAGGHVRAFASGAVSIRMDREVEAGFQLPHLAGDRLVLTLTGVSTRLAQEKFFGLGPSSSAVDRSTFELDRESVGAMLTATPARWLRLSGGVDLLSTSVDAGTAQRLAASASDFIHTQASAVVDYRDEPGNPRSGGRYAVAVHRYADRGAARHSFTRVDADLEQNVSFWKKQRLFTVRAIVSVSDADEGHDVPFYMQRTLGGSRLLRGFVHDRFRDRNLMVLQGEYAWDIWPFLNAVLFYEVGKVAPRASDLSFSGLRRDYGFGVRLGSTRSVALRTDVAFGSGEGTRLIMRFSHAF
jgi:outer membrane protein assembly factor BamA